MTKRTSKTAAAAAATVETPVIAVEAPAAVATIEAPVVIDASILPPVAHTKPITSTEPIILNVLASTTNEELEALRPLLDEYSMITAVARRRLLIAAAIPDDLAPMMNMQMLEKLAASRKTATDEKPKSDAKPKPAEESEAFDLTLDPTTLQVFIDAALLPANSPATVTVEPVAKRATDTDHSKLYRYLNRFFAFYSLPAEYHQNPSAYDTDNVAPTYIAHLCAIYIHTDSAILAKFPSTDHFSIDLADLSERVVHEYSETVASDSPTTDLNDPACLVDRIRLAPKYVLVPFRTQHEINESKKKRMQ